jgi:hypothetical protein
LFLVLAYASFAFGCDAGIQVNITFSLPPTVSNEVTSFGTPRAVTKSKRFEIFAVVTTEDPPTNGHEQGNILGTIKPMLRTKELEKAVAALHVLRLQLLDRKRCELLGIRDAVFNAGHGGSVARLSACGQNVELGGGASVYCGWW